MNNMLPSYFEYMKPVQPVACNYYGIRKPRLHPPIINHEFGEQMVQYCLIKILNEDNHETTLNKNNIYSQSFFTFNSLSAMGDRGRQPPLLPPLLGATRVDTIIHNYRLSAPP